MYIGTFKKDIDEIHNQYQIEVKRAIPESLNELEVRINENDPWRILKYYNSALRIQRQIKNTRIRNKHIIENMNIEARRVYKTYLS